MRFSLICAALALFSPLSLQAKQTTIGTHDAKKFYQSFQKGSLSVLYETWQREILSELTPFQWKLLRNALYAKHGYRFRSRRLQRFFSRMKWYKPKNFNVDQLLDNQDLANIELIKNLENAVRLYGIWQDSPILGSGWGKTYRFFPKRKFIFHFSQMDCEKKELRFSGLWHLEKDKLVLLILEKTSLEGGTLIPATGSCASEKEWENAQIKTITLETPEKIEMSLSNVFVDKTADKKAFILQKQKYWQFTPNPDVYDKK